MGYTWIALKQLVTMNNCREIEKEIKAVLTGNADRVALDLSNTNNIYSYGIGLIIRINKYVTVSGGFLCLVNVSDKCREQFESVNLHKLFPLYATDVEFEISRDDVWQQKLHENNSGFICIVHTEGNRCRINLTGKMIASPDLSRFNPSISQDGITYYVFDLTGLDVMDTAGASLLLAVILEIAEHKGRCVSYGGSYAVNELIGLLSISEYLPCYENEQQALEALEKT